MFDLKKCFVQETYSYVSNKESYGDRERERERERELPKLQIPDTDTWSSIFKCHAVDMIVIGRHSAFHMCLLFPFSWLEIFGSIQFSMRSQYLVFVSF